MVSLLPLVQNEMLKIWKKRRFLVVVLILAILIPIFVYANLKVTENNEKQFGTKDWRVITQQQIYDYTNRIGSSRVPEEWKEWMRVEVQRLQYHLDHNVNPDSPDGAAFSRTFTSEAAQLFLPLLITVIASDLVSGEHSTGTIKLLLTRPVNRWRILMSKLIALSLYTSLIVLATALLSYLMSGVVFGYGGWNAPILTGFQIVGDSVDLTYVHTEQQWFYMIMELGLVWFGCMTVAVISLMISVLVRSTAAGMGIMMAAIIAGTILVNMVSSWETAKYLFVVNLGLTTYLEGSLPPIKGMNLGFSLVCLAVWALASLVVSFRVFTKRDVLN